MKNKFKTLISVMVVILIGLNVVSIHALDGEGTPVQLPAGTPDGVMSNPDGYEKSKARGAGFDMHWTVENGQKVMYDGQGARFGEGEAKKVIDVSTYNGNIDWNAVKNGGVDGAILRATSYASGNIAEDNKFGANAGTCKNVQMPFGVYLYSYSQNAQDALYEANYLVDILQRNGIAPSDLTYPVYLDLEGNNYTNGISVATYEQIVATFIGRMEAAGYKTHVYSYKSYLENNLNSPNIHKYVSWIAQYGRQLTFNNQYYSGLKGWQYQSNGRVAGVNGEVDVNCFTGLYNDVVYQTHVQYAGWQSAKGDGLTAGTIGQSRRLEAICIALPNQKYSGSIQYQTHVEGIGWLDWVNGGTISGTSGRSLRLEAMKVQLTGEMANHYDVYYRVHAQNFGWLDWAKNGEASGTAGYGYRLEAMEIKLVEKGNSAPGGTNAPFRQTLVRYQTHVQNVGWQGRVKDGAVSGTSGQSLRLEGITIALDNQIADGSIEYCTHVQNDGWQGWRSNETMSGTAGRSLRLEAIQIRLTGTMASTYDVYYRVHSQDYGWLGWAKNGESSGTEGKSLRLEAIQVVLINKGGGAPGSTANAFIK